MTPKLYGALYGLLTGSVWGHLLRLVVLAEGPSNHDTTGRVVVAAVAVLMYSVAALLAWYEDHWACFLAIGGPIGGLLAVTAIPGATIDTYQVVLGLLQGVAAAVAVYILYLTHGGER